MTITYDQLLDRVIADGIAEVQNVYAKPEDHHKRDGAIDGFEACRGKSPLRLVELWKEAEEDCSLARAEELSTDDYWRLRFKALQVEFVLNVISVGLGQPLLAHLPTSRGVHKYAQIVGVRGGAS